MITSEGFSSEERSAQVTDISFRKIFTLWDANTDPPESIGLVYCWNGHQEHQGNNSIHSLFRYVETHGERLRRKYLAWIHDLGETQIGGKRLIDHLAFEDGLSYWWMTLFVEKSPWKSPSIIDAIRLLALEEIVVQQKPGKLRLVSANRNLHRVLSDLCQNLRITYEWERLSNKSLRRLNLADIYRVLPQWIQVIISIARQMRVRWPLKQIKKPPWFRDDRSVFFCSYFNSVDYWKGLNVLLRRMRFQSNWLQLFIPCPTIPTSAAAINSLKYINQQNQGQDFHAFLDAYLSWGVVLHVLKRGFRLIFVSWCLHNFKDVFRASGSHIWLWPCMQRDWLDSMVGSVAVSNLLWIELFDKAMRDLPHQKKGVYLCENQAWERALIHAWRKHGHGQLIAVQHSLVRFWDLRYFSDPRIVSSSTPHSIPQADFLALNGQAAIKICLGLDTQKAIVECEALRYGYMNNLQAKRRSRSTKGRTVKVLILGDYMPSSTAKMLQLLEASLSHVSVQITFTLKPHSNCPVNPGDYSLLNFNLVMNPLGEILHDFDIAYSSNMTSAAVDAYFADLPVVVMLDETTLDFSPLRGQPDVSFVSTYRELAQALQMAAQNSVQDRDHREFFFLDPELPRWRQLLSSNELGVRQ